MTARLSDQFHAGRGADGQRASLCVYCAESLQGFRIVHREVDGERKAFCCLACAFMAEQIALAGARLGRSAVRDRDDDARAPAAMRQPARTQIEIRGMVCAACALLLEERLRATPGVSIAQVDFAARRATVVYDRNRVGPPELEQTVLRAGYRVVAAGQPDGERRAERIELLRVLIAWLAMIQVIVLAVPGYLARPGEIGPALEHLQRLSQLVLTIPVVLFSAVPLWRAAISQLRVGQIGTDVAAALGLCGALGASFVSLVAGGPVYFDSITMFVALLLSVRIWQQRALTRGAAQIDAAIGPTASQAQRLLDHPRSSEFETVASDRLLFGDRVIVAAGARVPADGCVIEGRSALSQVWLTGESAPVEAEPGEQVLAGAVNLEQPLVVEVLRSGDHTSLAALQRLIVESASQRPRSVELANRVASRLVLVLLGASIGTAVGWGLIDAPSALRNAIAVLIATCPCALWLAAPLATAAAQVALARRGILLARPSALEELTRVDAVAFDRTGILTEAVPAMTGILSMGEEDDAQCLRIAASLAARSGHPFARALLRTAEQARVALAPVCSLLEVAGAGVEGSIEGERYRLGKPEFALGVIEAPDQCVEFGLTLALHGAQAGTGLILADRDGPIAIFCFGERVRADAARVLAHIGRAGTDLMMVSGDRRAAVQETVSALDLGAKLHAYAEQSPAGKQALLAGLQSQGRRIAMIGDGINAGPVLAQADASIALASGSEQTQARADIICLRSRLADVGFAFDLARRTTRVVRANLLWALAYSAAMIPLAIAGRLSPAMAAVGMAASSAIVAANSIRLGLRRP